MYIHCLINTMYTICYLHLASVCILCVCILTYFIIHIALIPTALHIYPVTVHCTCVNCMKERGTDGVL